MGPAIKGFNSAIMDSVRANAPEIMWVEKGVFVWPFTLREAREQGVKFLVLYSPDNYFLRQNSSRHLWNGLPLYDIVVTTKTHNVDRLREKGAKFVSLSGNAFDPEIHRPVLFTDEEKKEYLCDVSFIGRWEPEREKWLEKVASLDVKLNIWGYRWSGLLSAA